MRFPAIIFWILVSAWGAEYLHLHSGFGALLAGSMFARIPGLAKQWHASMNGFMHYLLLPVLFVSAGLKTHFDFSMATQDIAWIIGFTLLAFITKFSGALLGARISGYSLHDWRAHEYAWSDGAGCAVYRARIASYFTTRLLHYGYRGARGNGNHTANITLVK